MASRKDDEAHHPGSYVQVVGTPRRRKSSATKQAITEVNSSAVERVSVPAGRYRLDSSTEQGSGQQEVAAERVFSPPRRAQHGPLGMEEKRAEPAKPEPSTVKAAKTTAIGLGPDLRADIAAAQAIIDQQRAERAREMLSESQPMPTERFDRAHLERAQKGSSERMRVREISEAATDPSQESAHDRFRDKPPPESLAPRAEVMRAPSLSPAQPQVQSQPLARMSDQPPMAALEVEKELPSLLSVRPSLHPSDPAPVQRQGASIAMVVGIAVLSSIIAAAGVVALQEVFHRRDSRMAEPAVVQAPVRAPSAAPVETSHHAAVSVPVAEPAPAPAAPAAAAAVPEPTPVAAEPVAAEPAPVPVAAPAARVAGPRALGAPVRPAVAAPVRQAVAAPVAKRAVDRPSEPKNRVLNGDFVAPGSGASLGSDPSDPLPSNPY